MATHFVFKNLFKSGFSKLNTLSVCCLKRNGDCLAKTQRSQRPHSIAGAGMRHGLYSGCPQQSLYALSRKGAKNAKATSNCRDLVGRIRAGPKGMFDRLSISVRRPPSRVLPDACLWGDASLSS